MRMLFVGLFLMLLTSEDLLAYSQHDVNSDTLSKNKDISYSFDSWFIGASKSNIPFWQRANLFGIVPTLGPTFALGVTFKKDYSKKRFDVGYGLEGWGNMGRVSRLILPQAYVKAKFKKLEIWAGRRKQVMGIVGDSLLTSGSYIVSGNSIPMPQIQIGFNDYVDILNKTIGLKGTFAHAWFDANPVVKKHFLHQKSLYIRLGKTRWPVNLYGGFNHSVQWGGTVLTANRYTVGSKNPSDLKDYWYVISGKRIPTFGYVDPDKYDAIDRGNRVGNHLGSVDLAMQIKLRTLTIIPYRTFLFDDGSLFHMANIRDGLNGISLKFKESTSKIQISSLTAEFLYTRHQGGSEFTLDGGPRGRDNYFNHIQYEGWVYNGNIIGTPFITSKLQTRQSLKKPTIFYISDNNRVKLYHLGFSGRIFNSSFTSKLSLSENWGTYNAAFERRTVQFSSLLNLFVPVKIKSIGTLEGMLSLATDIGKLYQNSTGIQVGLIKRGNF